MDDNLSLGYENAGDDDVGPDGPSGLTFLLVLLLFIGALLVLFYLV